MIPAIGAIGEDFVIPIAEDAIGKQKADSFFGNPKKGIVIIYQVAATVVALAAVIGVVASILLRDKTGVAESTLLLIFSGGGAILAHKYRQLKSLNEVTDSLENENHGLKNQVKQFGEQNLTLHMQIKTLESDALQFQKSNTELAISVQAFQKNQHDLDEQVVQFRTENGELAVKIQRIEKANQQLEEQLKSFNEENLQLKGTLEKFEKTSAKFSMNLGELVKNEEAFDLMRKQYETLKSDFEIIRQKEVDYDAQKRKLEEGRQKLDDEYRAKENEILQKLENSMKKIQELENQLLSLKEFRLFVGNVKKISPAVYSQCRKGLSRIS